MPKLLKVRVSGVASVSGVVCWIFSRILTTLIDYRGSVDKHGHDIENLLPMLGLLRLRQIVDGLKLPNLLNLLTGLERSDHLKRAAVALPEVVPCSCDSATAFSA